MKLFISQPMRGRSDEEILEERERIKKNFPDDEIIDSFFEDYEPTTGNMALKYLAKSIELLADADTAVFCEGFEKARGCMIEYQCAVAYGIEIRYAESLEDDNDETGD